MNNHVRYSIEVLKELRMEVHDKVDASILKRFDMALVDLEQQLARSNNTHQVRILVLSLLGQLLAHLPAIKSLLDRIQ